MCVRVFVHVGHAKVSARAPQSYDVWLRHKAWAEDLLYKVFEARPRSQCGYVMGRERAM